MTITRKLLEEIGEPAHVTPDAYGFENGQRRDVMLSYHPSWFHPDLIEFWLIDLYT